jgi:hypothetical protein
MQPNVGLQLSVVQPFRSSQEMAVPALQTPAWHVSPPLHTSPSAHDVPSVTAAVWQPRVGLQKSPVHGLPSPQESGVPAVHEPA